MALQPVLGPSRCQDFFPSVPIVCSSSPPTSNTKGLEVHSIPSNHLSLGLPARLLPSDRSKVINLPLFSTVLPSNSCFFLSCRPFVVNTTFSTGLVGVKVTSVSWLGQ